MKKILSVCTAALIGLSACGALPGSSAANPTPTVAGAVVEPRLVVADAIVVPQQSVELTWQTTGTLAELLVKESDAVKKGAPLARIDPRDAELQVAQAEAALQKAQADYDQLLEGASPEEVAAAEAQVAAAQAQLQQARGSVTSRDIAAAQAQVAAAQARLSVLLKGATSSDLKAAQAQLAQAQANLTTQRDSLSASKTKAYEQMQQAVNALTQAQTSYATAKSDWEFVSETGQNPSNPEVTGANGQKVPNKVNETQRQQYYDAFVKAEAALHSAESAVEVARVAYDAARQNEVSGVAQANAQVQNAQASVDRLVAGTSADQIAAARADVAKAQASLDKLRGQELAGKIKAGEAQVQNAQANLEKLSVSPRSSALARGKAQIAQAEVGLKQAKLALERTQLTAPINGTVVETSLKVGEVPSQAGPVIMLADLSTWKIETTRLTELQVVQIKVGDAVKITFDALPGVALDGHVTHINPLGKNKEGDMTYTVTVLPDQQDQRLYWNMSAAVNITPSAAP